MGRVKWAFASAALAAVMVSASAASATTPVVISNGTMTNPISVKLTGSVYNGDVEDAPMNFTATIDGKTRDILAYCVDIYHEISTGEYKPSLQYETNTFKTDSNPNPQASDYLSAATIEQVDTLVNYGTALDASTKIDTTQKSIDEAEVQGAIWQLVSGENVTMVAASDGSGADKVTASTFDNVIDELSSANYKSYFLSGYSSIGDTTTFITPIDYPNKKGTQAFLFAGGVPEPASWAMMICGLGLVGAALRRRRTAVAVAAQA